MDGKNHMSDQQSRWDKLAAVVNDKAATEPERHTARKLLCELDARMGGREIADETTITVHASQSWELALLNEVSTRYGLQPETRDDLVRLTGAAEAVEEAMFAFYELRPEMERVMLLTAAGWLARHFPKKALAQPSGEPLPEEEMRLVWAAAASARPGQRRPVVPASRRIEEKEVLWIEQKD